MAGQAAEYSVATPQQALLERLRDEFLLHAYEYWTFDRDDDALAEGCFSASGVEDAVETIGEDTALLAFALHPSTTIRVGDSPRPLFMFENGAGSALDDDWLSSDDLPVGVTLVVYDGLVANATASTGLRRQVNHRRAEAAYFRAEADKRPSTEREMASALNELAKACEGDAECLEPITRDIERGVMARRAEQVVVGRRHATRRGIHGRRLDRRLARGRPRARAVARASSRGGDSGDSSDDPEPAGFGAPVGDTSRVLHTVLAGVGSRTRVSSDMSGTLSGSVTRRPSTRPRPGTVCPGVTWATSPPGSPGSTRSVRPTSSGRGHVASVGPGSG